MAALSGTERTHAFEFVAPVGAVLHLHPSPLAWEVRLVLPLRDDAVEVVLANRGP
jgi:hypothetical protein